MLSVVLKKQPPVTLTAAREILALLTQLDTIFGVSNHFLICGDETFGKTLQTKAANFSFYIFFFFFTAAPLRGNLSPDSSVRHRSAFIGSATTVAKWF